SGGIRVSKCIRCGAPLPASGECLNCAGAKDVRSRQIVPAVAPTPRVPPAYPPVIAAPPPTPRPARAPATPPPLPKQSIHPSRAGSVRRNRGALGDAQSSNARFVDHGGGLPERRGGPRPGRTGVEKAGRVLRRWYGDQLRCCALFLGRF